MLWIWLVNEMHTAFQIQLVVSAQQSRQSCSGPPAFFTQKVNLCAGDT